MCVARNEDRALTPGQRNAVRGQTQKVLDASGPLMRRHYARMHRLWLLVKAKWDEAAPPERLLEKMRMRWAVIEAFGKIARTGAATPSPGGDLASSLALRSI